MSKKLIIYEGMLCCSTGICGPEPDKALIQLTEDVRRLQAEFPDAKIIRASMSFNAQAYLEEPEVLKLVKTKGTDVLPITVLNGKILVKERYMTYDEMKSALLAAQ
ncbi:MAG: arsenic metallochaperone ArsD family protein [Methanomassiliicoccales archaeon]|nr:arsenic metallochaperone ArsD family protein [Methanomassiliicoccales archaeon]